jgi:oligopeptide transport system substrate-binding protein
VNRACVEKYGVPNWTKPENIVSNGAYTLESRRIRDRIRLVKNPDYWNAENVQIETIDALAVNSLTTALNMYVTGQVDWIIKFPNKLVPIIESHDKLSDDYNNNAPMFTTYFYRINVTRPPGDNKLVRQALNLALNKREICQAITRGGEVPARSLVPPIAGYEAPLCDDYDVGRARELLAEAGYPGGRGMPPVEIMFNTAESHRTIAEKIQSDWKTNLGIDVELKQQEWGVYLASVRALDYWIVRAGWIADYADPNTFLDMFVTGGENNQTGWANEQYDELIARAAEQVDLVERAKTLAAAEAILMDELPIIPIYFYVSTNLVRPYVKNFYANAQDIHPLPTLRVDQSEKAEYLKAAGLR